MIDLLLLLLLLLVVILHVVSKKEGLRAKFVMELRGSWGGMDDLLKLRRGSRGLASGIVLISEVETACLLLLLRGRVVILKKNSLIWACSLRSLKSISFLLEHKVRSAH